MENTLTRDEVILLLSGQTENTSRDWLKVLENGKLRALLRYWAIGLILDHTEYEACTAYDHSIPATFLLRERKKLRLGTVTYHRNPNPEELKRAEAFKEFYSLHIDKPYMSYNVKESAWKDVQKAFADKWFSVDAREYIKKCSNGEHMFNVLFALEPEKINKNIKLLQQQTWRLHK